VNDAPVAPPQQVVTDEDVPRLGVLAALDVDGDALSFALVTGPAHGTVSLAADGRYVFTPDEDWSGDDVFTAGVTDGNSDPVTFLVAVHVDPVNDGPACPSQCLVTNEDVPLSGVLAASDADGDALSFLLVDGPAHGTLALATDGHYVYTPAKDWNGDDSFRVTVSDGNSAPVTLVVSVRVDAVNDPPVAGPVEFRAAAHAAAGTVVGTFAATDADGDRLSYAITGGDPKGAFAVGPNTGVLAVADRSQLVGGAVFTLTLTVSDGHGGKTCAVVTVRVLKENLSFKVGRSATNAVDLGGLRWQPVVIYSTAGFDARKIDVKSLSFGRTGDERSFVNDRGRSHWSVLVDVNGDGRKDLVILFDARKTGLRAGDTSATLKGRMKDGTAFAGAAPVTVKTKAPAGHGWK
jgi:VCBS repeat-containing protein